MAASSRRGLRFHGRCCWWRSTDGAQDTDEIRPRSSIRSAPVTNGAPPQPDASSRHRSYGRSARILTIGIASTGIFTFLYLAFASHELSPAAYSRISLCWAIMFVILSVIYRPIEQLLSRMIADRRARGLHGHPLRIPATIQLGFALLFLAVALSMRSEIEQGIFDGSSALYWILVVGVLAYAASYFARGWLAGHQRFDLYGGLVFLESTSRFLFALAVAVGIASGQAAVGLGMAVAPFASLCVIPFAFTHMRHRAARARRRSETPVPPNRGRRARRRGRGARPRRVRGGRHRPDDEARDRLRRLGGRDHVRRADADERRRADRGRQLAGAALTAGLTGFVFNVLLIVRAPLQLFQAIQTSILPHLAGLEARESADEFHRAIRITVLAIAGLRGRGRARAAGSSARR